MSAKPFLATIRAQNKSLIITIPHEWAKLHKIRKGKKAYVSITRAE